MPFQKGQSGNPRGRKRGEPNKLTRDIKSAIETAFHKVGGSDYLERIAESDPAVFCGLLGKVLPTQLQHSGGVAMRQAIDRPANETRQQWIERRQQLALAAIPPAGSAE